MKIYAKPGTNQQIIDYSESIIPPSDCVEMPCLLLEISGWIATDHGTWEDNRAGIERRWAMTELARSDRALTPDFPASKADRENIMAYRAKLRNPLRSNHKDFPDPAWRPQWPEGVKRPAV